MATQRSWQAEQRDWLLGLGLRAVFTSAGEHRWARGKWDGHPQQLLYARIPKDENRKQAFTTGGWFSPGEGQRLGCVQPMLMPRTGLDFLETQGTCPSTLQLWNVSIWTSCTPSSDFFGEPLQPLWWEEPCCGSGGKCHPPTLIISPPSHRSVVGTSTLPEGLVGTSDRYKML